MPSRLSVPARVRLRRADSQFLQFGPAHKPRRRPIDIETIRRCLGDITWSPSLVRLLIAELNGRDEVEALLGPISRLPARALPHAVAIAILTRYRWRRDLFNRIVRRLSQPHASHQRR